MSEASSSDTPAAGFHESHTGTAQAEIPLIKIGKRFEVKIECFYDASVDISVLKWSKAVQFTSLCFPIMRMSLTVHLTL